MDRKRLYDLGKFITEKLYGLERKVFLMMDADKELQQERENYLASGMSREQVMQLQKRIDSAKREKKKMRFRASVRKITAAVSVAAVFFVVLPNTSGGVASAMEQIPLFGQLVSVVTFRNYHYEDEQNVLDLQVPELVVGGDFMTTSLAEGEAAETDGKTAAADGKTAAADGKTAAADGKTAAADGKTAAAEGEAAETDGKTAAAEGEAAETDGKTAAADGEAAETVREAAKQLERTTAVINEEIRSISAGLIKEFEENLNQEQGQQSIMVQSEILSATESFFSLKLICYQQMGSAAEWDYYYTIDLRTGERLTLAGLFADREDYQVRISEEIRRQMQEQMTADSNLKYWLDDPEVPEWNFCSITEETDFYLDQDGRLVICFDEGEVAPMYMGCVEFRMPEEIYQR